MHACVCTRTHARTHMHGDMYLRQEGRDEGPSGAEDAGHLTLTLTLTLTCGRKVEMRDQAGPKMRGTLMMRMFWTCSLQLG